MLAPVTGPPARHPDPPETLVLAVTLGPARLPISPPTSPSIPRSDLRLMASPRLLTSFSTPWPPPPHPLAWAGEASAAVAWSSRSRQPIPWPVPATGGAGRGGFRCGGVGLPVALVGGVSCRGHIAGAVARMGRGGVGNFRVVGR
ncbi:hypothetical protein GCM10023259_082320 [Thermocatellispora tengchongensis]